MIETVKKSIEEADLYEEFEQNGYLYIKLSETTSALVMNENCEAVRVTHEKEN